MKVVGSWEKGHKNAESVMKSPTGPYRLDVMSIPSRREVGDVSCTASRRSATTSPKPLGDKPHHKTVKPYRQTDKPGACSRSLPTGLIVFVGRYL